MKTAKLISQKLYSMIFIILLCSQMFGQSRPSVAQFSSYSAAAIKTKSPKNLQPPAFSADRIRFQQQATFGYSPALDTYIASLPNGIESYLDEQLTTSITPPNLFPDYTDTIHDYSIKPLQPRLNCNNTNLMGPPDESETTPNCFRDTYTMYPLQQWFFKEALYGSAQLRHRVAWSLSQLWVTSALEIKQSRHMAEYYKILYNYALGDDNNPNTLPLPDDSYLGLMKAMTLSPAMGEYLDMAYSQKQRTVPNTTTVIKPNENYPRELLQLFTTGPNQLVVVNAHPQLDPRFSKYGTEKLDANGKPIPVYTQNEINNFAKVFTGWTFCNAYIPPNGSIAAECPQARLGAINYIDQMKLFPSNHDASQKVLFSNVTIAACGNANSLCPTADEATEVYAKTSLDTALQNIFNHPNVPPFVSKHLIQQLVTSNPSPQYLKRVADKFINDGYGKRGNMKAVIRAILLDPEARGDSKIDPFGKLREPVQFTTNILRAFRVRGVSANESDGVVFEDKNFLKMNQRPFYSPSVFNYYSPKNTIIVGINDTLLAPEFGLFTPTTAVSRANFAHTLVLEDIPANSPNVPNGTALDLSEMISIYENAANDPAEALVEELNKRLLNWTMPIEMKTTILGAMAGRGVPTGDRVKIAVYLVVTSAEFQVQR